MKICFLKNFITKFQYIVNDSLEESWPVIFYENMSLLIIQHVISIVYIITDLKSSKYKISWKFSILTAIILGGLKCYMNNCIAKSIQISKRFHAFVILIWA